MNLLRFTLRQWLVLAGAILLLLVLFSSKADAASFTYPSSAPGNPSDVYVTASRQGNGIYLEAPYAVVKIKYSSEATTLGVSIQDACWWASIDAGTSRPAGCQGGHVTVNICTSNAQGSYDNSYKGTGRCVQQDPAGWGGGGTGTQNFTFGPGSFGGVPVVDGYYNLFVIVGQNTGGLNGFKVTGSGANTVLAGFAATTGGDQPMSLVRLPLSGSGETEMRVNFSVPCGDTSGRFRIRWFDADKGVNGTPQDYNIRFAIYNTTTGQSFSSQQLAFISSQSEETFLGGQGENREFELTNSPGMRVQQNDQFTWHWAGVRNNNGIQIYTPYDEPDRILACPPPSVECTQSAIEVQTNQSVTFNVNPSNTSYSWSAPGGTPASGTARAFATAWSTIGTKTITITTPQGSDNCVVNVIAPPPPPSPCPNNPTFNTTVPVTMPNTAPGNAGPLTGQSTTSAGASYYEYRRTGIVVTGSEDISNPNAGSGSFDVDAVPADANYDLIVSNFSQPSPSGSASATLDYNIFLQQCPFDENQGQIVYRSNYERQLWRSSSTPNSYQCNGYSPATRSGTTCTYTYGATPYCSNSNYSWNGSSCVRYAQRNLSGACSLTGTGASCLYASTSPSYYCSLGGTRSGTTCYYYYTATAYYNWNTSGSRENSLFTPGTANGAIMPPCFNRTYNATAALNSTQLADDPESPFDARMTGTISVAFNVVDPTKGQNPMRRASSINNLPYTITRYIRRGTAQLSIVNENRTITVTGGLNKSSSGSTGFAHNFGVSVPGNMQVGDRACWRISLTQLSATGSRRAGQMNNVGNYVGGGNGQQVVEACSEPVVNWPYFKVLGNDVVGGGSAGTCSTGGTGTIRAHTRTLGVGSTAQYAAFAMSAIQGFGTATLLNNTAPAFFPKQPTGLTFANTSGAGGNYAANDGVTCMADYFGAIPPNAVPIGAGDVATRLTTPNTDPKAVEYHTILGNVPLGSIVVPNGVRKVFFIEGGLNLSGDAAGNGVIINTSWANREEVSFVMFITRNTVISNSVRRLDGIYAAQNDGWGTISTCESLSFACQNPLTVNGAMFADNIRFLRTRGSLRDARVNEGRTGINSASPCSAGGAPTPITTTADVAGASCVAEVINFSPEFYITFTQLLSIEESFKLDSYVVLPPNL